ncbi:MAG TPA: hypothetical protein VMF08_09765 [Candidatus Sulfotelmatobacter sp.]|nr:hypothetical protein [Candidatus Sulfotelmatobacter sp.]
MAQSVLAPPPAAPPLVPAAVEAYQTNQPVQMQVFSPSAMGAPAPLNQPFQLGPFVFRPNILYQFMYGNGIQSSPGAAQNTIVQQFSPAVVIQEGLHWTLNYTPLFTFYSTSAFQNTVNQNVQLQWGTTWGDWFLTAAQSYAYSDQPDAETAGQTEQQTYVTTFNGTYHINEKLSTDIGFNQTFNDYGQNSSTNLTLGLSNSRSWSTMNWLNDQFWPRFNGGIGVGFGYNQQQGSPDFLDQQLQAQVSWRATDKFSFQLNGGLQAQQYLSGGASGLVTPIFGGGLQYQPFDQTRFSVNANRTVASSAYVNQVVETTSVTGDFNQRLFGAVFLDLSGGYSWGDYISSAADSSAARNDDTYTFSSRLSCPFPKRGTVSIFYQYSKNVSTQNGFTTGSSAFGYSSNQVGFSLSYTY